MGHIKDSPKAKRPKELRPAYRIAAKRYKNVLRGALAVRSKEDVARACEIHANKVRDWLKDSNKRVPDVIELLLISARLKINLHDLLGLTAPVSVQASGILFGLTELPPKPEKTKARGGSLPSVQTLDMLEGIEDELGSQGPIPPEGDAKPQDTDRHKPK